MGMSSPQLAVCMLTVREPEFVDEWLEWANASPGDVRFFVNGKTDFECALPRIADEVRDTRWGTHSIALAEIALIRAALLEKTVTHCVIVQGDSLPVRPLKELLSVLRYTGELNLFDRGARTKAWDELERASFRSNFEGALAACQDESNWWKRAYRHQRPSANLDSKRYVGYTHQCCLLSRVGAEQIEAMPSKVLMDYDAVCKIDPLNADATNEVFTYFMGAEEVVFEAWIRSSLGPRCVRHMPLMHCEASKDGRHAALLTTRLGSSQNFFARKFVRGQNDGSKAFCLAKSRRRGLCELTREPKRSRAVGQG